MNKTVLITGGAGFIGSHLIKEILLYNYNVVLLKRTSTNLAKIREYLHYIKVYNIDRCTLDSIFTQNKIDYVIHLAGAYKKCHKIDDIERFIKSNIEFGTQILECMSKHKVKYFINTGTFFEYKIERKLIKEDQDISPYNLYAATKRAFFEIVKYYSKNFDIKVIEFKLFSPYGPKDDENKLMGYIINNHLNNEIFRMTPSQQKWNWTYVKDIAKAYVKGIQYFDTMESNLEVFNIGSNKTHSVREVIETIEKLSSNKKLVVYDKNYSKGELFYVNCDNTKAEEKLNWKPKFTLYQGLLNTYKYYYERRGYDD